MAKNGTTPSQEPTPLRPRRRGLDPETIESVPVVLEPGRTRHFRLDLEAMFHIHQETGLVLWENEGWDAIRRDPMTLSTVMYWMLMHEDADLTPESVRKLPYNTIANLAYITNRMWDLYGIVLPAPPTPEEIAEAEAAAQAAGDDGEPGPNAQSQDSTTSGPTRLRKSASVAPSSGD